MAEIVAPREPEKKETTKNVIIMALVILIVLLLAGAVYAVIDLSNKIDGSGNDLSNKITAKITTEITGLKKWANDTFVSKDDLNKELDKRLAKKKPSGAKTGDGGKKAPARSQSLRASPRQETPRYEERMPPPDGCRGGQWVRSEGGAYQCFVQKRIVMRPPVDDSAKVVAEACAPLGIIPNGRGGWKCRPEPVATAPVQQTSPMPTLYSLKEEPKPEYSINQSAMWAAIGCGVNLLVGGGGSDCLRGAVISGAGDAIGQHFGGPTGGHVGGAVGTIGSAAKVKRIAPPTPAAGGAPVNPPVAGGPVAPPL